MILTRPNHEKGERDHVWPYFLPGGHAVLFTILPIGAIENAQIAVLDLRDGTQKVVVKAGSDARYVQGGYVVYGFAGTLRAVAFDVDRLEVRGTPVPVLQQIVTTPVEGAANFGVAANGTLTYAFGALNNVPQRRTLVWVDRAGRSTPVYEREADYRAPRLSPDGKRIAVDVTAESTSGTPNRDIWVIDVGLGTQTRLTSDPGVDSLPLWTPDGKRLVFSSDRAGGASLLYWMPADGTGTPEPLTKGDSSQGATSWSPDGRTLAFYDVRGAYDMFTMKVGERPISFSQTPFREQGPTFSPDGRWIAYSSNETGRDEVYIAPYPGPGGRIAVSTDGGRAPRWSANGRELFYRNGRQMMAARIDSGPTLRIAAPRLLFEGDYIQENIVQGAQNYDVSADGQRFLMIKDAASSNQANTPPPQIFVVQHFDDELRRLVPTK
jgi:dipeptidyl aminopeptidase/acylaminoacyl peptidase